MAEGRYEKPRDSGSGGTATMPADIGLIERAFLMGIGAAMLAKDRVQELADDLVERGKMTRDEAGTLVNRMYAEADDANRSMQEMIARETKRVMGGMGLASANDIASIREELTEIKEMIVAQRPMGAAEDEWTPGQ